jgi:sacsin
MIDSPNGVTLTYMVFVETLKYSEDGSVDKTVYKWLINEYKAGMNVSAKLQSLQKDPSLPLVPLVGVAMAIDRPKPKAKPASSESSNQANSDLDSPADKVPEKEEQSKPEGQVFCFLPLPIEQKTATGLPVHVNGYFAISQNRRHLKWPTTGHNIKSDKSIMWNQCLLEELVPVSYTQLLLQAKELAMKDNLVSPEDVYDAMPDLVNVDEKWQIILEPLFNKIFKHPVIHTRANGGQWISVEDVIFDCMKEDESTSNTVTEVLLRCDVNVAKVPRHLLHALGAYSQHSLEIVSPALVRATIKSRANTCRTLQWEHSLLLLRYCLKDEDFQDLIGKYILNMFPMHFRLT